MATKDKFAYLPPYSPYSAAVLTLEQLLVSHYPECCGLLRPFCYQVFVGEGGSKQNSWGLRYRISVKALVPCQPILSWSPQVFWDP